MKTPLFDRAYARVTAIAIIFLVILILIAVLFVFIDETITHIGEHYSNKCFNELKGDYLIFYDHDSPEMKAGTYCVLKNGSIVDITLREST